MTHSEMQDREWLAELLAEEPLEDEGFSHGVMRRIRGLRWARHCLNGVVGLAMMVLLAMLFRTGTIDQWLTHVPITGYHLLAVLLLLGVMGVFWIDIESRCLSLMRSKGSRAPS